MATLGTLAAAGCAGPSLTRDELRAELTSRPLPATLVTLVGPERLARDDQAARLIMGVEVDGQRVSEVDLCDLYFKAALASVDELRALGVQAAVDPGLWQIRHAAVASAVVGLDDASLALHLTRLGAQEDVPALFGLDNDQKRHLLASRRVLLAARTALPGALRVEQPTGLALRERYFALEGEPSPVPLRIEVIEARALAASPAIPEAEASAPGGVQEVEIAVDLALGPEPRHGLADEIRLRGLRYRVAAAPSGVRRRGAGYSVDLAGEPPLDGCFRLAMEDLIRAWLERRAAPSPRAPG